MVFEGDIHNKTSGSATGKLSCMSPDPTTTEACMITPGVCFGPSQKFKSRTDCIQKRITPQRARCCDEADVPQTGAAIKYIPTLGQWSLQHPCYIGVENSAFNECVFKVGWKRGQESKFWWVRLLLWCVYGGAKGGAFFVDPCFLCESRGSAGTLDPGFEGLGHGRRGLFAVLYWGRVCGIVDL